jgi:hypothetical protein
MSRDARISPADAYHVTADTAVREKARMNKEVMLQIADLGDDLLKGDGTNLERTAFSKQVEEAAQRVRRPRWSSKPRSRTSNARRGWCRWALNSP